jgi:hypothetical protein
MTRILLSVLMLAPPLQAVPAAPSSARANVQDAVGDAEPSFTELPSPDLRSATVDVSAGRGLALKVRFAKGTFNQASTYVQFSLNVGQERAVGDGACQTCGNYLVDINGIDGRPGQAQVQRLSPDSKYELLETLPVHFVAQGADVVVPWSLLPKGAKRLTYRVVTCIKLRDAALSRILDRMPDTEDSPPELVWR